MDMLPQQTYQNSDRTLFTLVGFGGGMVVFFALSVLLFAVYLTPSYCNVAVIDLHGVLLTHAEVEDPFWGAPLVGASSEYIVSQLEAAADDEDIEAIVLDIDSPGGLPVAAQEIEQALRSSPLPTFAIIRSIGTSAAYWAATGADTILASTLSDVGSIGVTASYVDAAKYDEAEGYTFNQLSTGEYKDLGHPDKPLTEAERSLVERDLDIILDEFVVAVATNRELSPQEVRSFADGASMLGTMALDYGLIDAVGGYETLSSFLEDELLGTPVYCR